jgi:G3E family GTPase
VNEIGEVGIDGDVIKRFGFDTKEITSGCICCSLKVGLRTTVTLLEKEYKPDILMIEPTGIAFPHVIKDEIELMNLGEQVKIAPLVTLIDGSRFKHLMKEVKEFAMRQIIDAEILVINKVDLIEPIRLPIIEASVQQLNPKARVVLLSGRETGEKFQNFMRIVLPDLEETLTKSQRTVAEKNSGFSEAQETENSIEASGVGCYSAEFTIENGNVNLETARELTTELMDTIKAKVLKLNPEFVGHIKLLMDNGLETVKQNSTIFPRRQQHIQEDIFNKFKKIFFQYFHGYQRFINRNRQERALREDFDVTYPLFFLFFRNFKILFFILFHAIDACNIVFMMLMFGMVTIFCFMDLNSLFFEDFLYRAVNCVFKFFLVNI